MINTIRCITKVPLAVAMAMTTLTLSAAALQTAAVNAGNGSAKVETQPEFTASVCGPAPASADHEGAKVYSACAKKAGKAFELTLSIQHSLTALDPNQALALRDSCGVTEGSADLPLLKSSLACVKKGPQKMLLFHPLQADLNENLLGQANVGGLQQPPSRHPSDTQPEAAKEPGPGSNDVKPGYSLDGHTGSSAYLTPSTCYTSDAEPGDNGMVTSHPEEIGVRRSIMAPKEASDDYGYRIGKRYIVYQVRVSNFTKDFQYVVHDISVNLNGLLGRRWLHFDKHSQGIPLEAFQSSTRELDFLRGVAEKGRDLDPRNLTLHTLAGIGSVAGGVSGLTPFSDVMGSAMAVFNGAFLQGLTGVAPDHSPTQLNRLSDQAFASNTLVDRLHTRTFSVFIPISVVLDNAQQKQFWGHTFDLLRTMPLDQVDVCVDGSLVTDATSTAPPEFSLATGNVGPAASLMLSDTDKTAEIYYTINGDVPTVKSTRYTAAITLSANVNDTQTIQAIAVASNKTQSSVATRVYSIKTLASAPKISPDPKAPEAYPLTITLQPGDQKPGVSLYYTTNGSTPTPGGDSTTSYTTPFQITGPAAVRAIAAGNDFAPSSVVQANYK